MLTQPKQEVPGEAAVSRRAFGRSKGDLPFNLDSNNMSRRAREKCLSDKARGSKPGGPPHLAGDVDAGITESVLLPAGEEPRRAWRLRSRKKAIRRWPGVAVPCTAETVYFTFKHRDATRRYRVAPIGGPGG